MLKILESTAATSDAFGSPGTRVTLLIDTHAGGVWRMETLTPAGNWVAVTSADLLDASGEWNFWPRPGGEYRLTGGTVGAQAWVSGANE